MNFQSLFYFRAVQTEGSIQQAAKKLQLSPQALSEHIKRLEAEVGVRLLNQTRPVTLSRAGERFGVFVNEVLLMKYRMEQELMELDGRKKRLMISTPLRGTPPFLAEVIRAFSMKYPDCAVHVQERSQAVSPQELRQYDLNLSMVEPGDELEYVKLMIEPPNGGYDEEPGYVYLTHRNLLQQQWGEECVQKLDELERTKDIRVLAEVPYIRFSDTSVTDALEKLLSAAHFYPKIVATSDNSELCFALCLAGVGASIIPISWLRQRTVPDDFYAFHLPQLHNTQCLYLGYEKNRTLSEEEREFIRILVARVGNAH